MIKMEKIEKLFNDYKGLILFYIIVAILTFMVTKKIEKINIANSEPKTEVRSYYA